MVNEVAHNTQSRYLFFQCFCSLSEKIWWFIKRKMISLRLTLVVQKTKSSWEQKRAECPASRPALRPFGWSITRSLRQAQLGWWLWCFFNGTYLQFFEDDDIVVMLRKAAFLRQDAFFDEFGDALT